MTYRKCTWSWFVGDSIVLLHFKVDRWFCVESLFSVHCDLWHTYSRFMVLLFWLISTLFLVKCRFMAHLCSIECIQSCRLMACFQAYFLYCSRCMRRGPHESACTRVIKVGHMSVYVNARRFCRCRVAARCPTFDGGHLGGGVPSERVKRGRAGCLSRRQLAWFVVVSYVHALLIK